MIDPGSIDPGRVPAHVVSICRDLQAQGFEAFAVGGAVRDLLLGREVSDWDVATNARPEEVQRVLGRCIPTGIKHGTVTVLRDDDAVEVTTYRGEGAYSDGRHPDGVEFLDELLADLQRRDFTINAMAFDPVCGELRDPLEGRADLDARVIRAVGQPLDRMREDGLRTMRAVRFATVLEFQIEDETRHAISHALDVFLQVSGERVRDELLKMLRARRPSCGVELMRETGLLDLVLPELVENVGLSQNEHHQEDVYQHSLRVCDAVQGDAIMRLTGLLHDIGKVRMVVADPPGRSGPTFHGHEGAGAAMCVEIAARLKLSNEQTQRMEHLVAHHLFALQPPTTKAGVRRLIKRVDERWLDDLFELRRADVTGRPGEEEALDALRDLRERINETLAFGDPLDIKALAIGGADLMGHTKRDAGPWVGRVLRGLLDRVLEEPSMNTREALLPLVDELLKMEEGG
ncbi:MAG: HD domain-containing protein [Deltaproteobacteria bacterium]|nr:HD domain-containing protein [Deltaproteobacteria bacterium]